MANAITEKKTRATGVAMSRSSPNWMMPRLSSAIASWTIPDTLRRSAGYNHHAEDDAQPRGPRAYQDAGTGKGADRHAEHDRHGQPRINVPAIEVDARA